MKKGMSKEEKLEFEKKLAEEKIKKIAFKQLHEDRIARIEARIQSRAKKDEE
jgi:hypothetical protein